MHVHLPKIQQTPPLSIPISSPNHTIPYHNTAHDINTFNTLTYLQSPHTHTEKHVFHLHEIQKNEFEQNLRKTSILLSNRTFSRKFKILIRDEKFG